MSPLSAVGVGVIIGAILGSAGGAWVNGWRWEAKYDDGLAIKAGEYEARERVAREEEARQRLIDFQRMEVNANVTYADQERTAALDRESRDRGAAIVGLRAALDAATARGDSIGLDPRSVTGADDAGALRGVVGECTAAYSEMVENAGRAGIKVKGLQDYIQGVRAIGP